MVTELPTSKSDSSIVLTASCGLTFTKDIEGRQIDVREACRALPAQLRVFVCTFSRHPNVPCWLQGSAEPSRRCPGFLPSRPLHAALGMSSSSLGGAGTTSEGHGLLGVQCGARYIPTSFLTHLSPRKLRRITTRLVWQAASGLCFV